MVLMLSSSSVVITSTQELLVACLRFVSLALLSASLFRDRGYLTSAKSEAIIFYYYYYLY